MSTAPETLYARSGDAHIAYHVLGDGPIDVLEMPSGILLSIEDAFDEPHWERFERRLAGFCRLIRYDFRGVGMSDPLDRSDPPTLERSAADSLAVLDEVGSQEAVVFATWHGGLPAMLLAATRPRRVRALVLMHCFPRMLRAPDYPAGVPSDVYKGFSASMTDPAVESVVDDVTLVTPALADDSRYRDWWRRASHRAASPITARAQYEVILGSDVRGVLATIAVPTLVIQRTENRVSRAASSRYLAEHIGSARYVELAGADHLAFAGDADAVADEIEEFVTGTRSARDADRVVATVLFTDILGRPSVRPTSATDGGAAFSRCITTSCGRSFIASGAPRSTLLGTVSWRCSTALLARFSAPVRSGTRS
jgi:pimeloyl-ACP methyl ester carboxylesterase